MGSDRDLDVVVLGAAGFVGRLVAGYLADHAPEGVRVGLAGRSRERLAGIRARLGSVASSWPLLVADVTDPASLAVLARAARVVATADVTDPASLAVLARAARVVATTAGPTVRTGSRWSRRALHPPERYSTMCCRNPARAPAKRRAAQACSG